MTRKDYRLIAASIEAHRAVVSCFASPRTRADYLSIVDGIAKGLADDLARDNPRFDRGRFLKACHVAETNGRQSSEAGAA
jgi:hypothetical protein